MSKDDTVAVRLARLGRRPRFSPDGTLVAYWAGQFGVTRGTMYVVPAAGGEPTPLQPGFAYAMLPVWSPNGKGLLFLGSRSRDSTAPPEAREDWWVTPLDGGSTVKTGAFEAFREAGIPGTPSPPAMWTVEDGRVFFWAAAGDSTHLWTEPISDRTNLWAVPISPDTGKVTGEPRPILGTTGGERDVWVSAGGRVVYASVVFNSDIWSLAIDPETGTAAPGTRATRLTHHPAYDGEPFMATRENDLAFISTRSGDRNVWLMDLASGSERAVTHDSLFKWFPVISPDATRVAYATARPNAIQVQNVSGGAKTLYADCGEPRFWTRDGQQILYAVYDAVRVRNVIGSLDLATGRKIRLLEHSEYDLLQPQLSPDGEWIAFNAATAVRSWVGVAPYRPGQETPEEDWIEITEGFPWEDHPRWSADGELLYFVSQQDGFRCIWARRLDPATREPVGASFEVYPSHSARRSMLNLGLHAMEISVAAHRIVFNLGELTGNISMARLTEQ